MGEWSMATDPCAMWLNGFNDSSNQVKHHDCEWVECPRSYLADEFAIDFDRTAEQLGPFGTGTESMPKNGQCPRDSAKWSSDKHMTKLGKDYIDMFDKHLHGQFFWNFRNELEPRWNYITAYDNGWLSSNTTSTIEPAEFLQ